MHILSLPEYIFFLDFIKDVDKNLNYDMSFYIKKLDTYKILNDIKDSTISIKKNIDVPGFNRPVCCKKRTGENTEKTLVKKFLFW